MINWYCWNFKRKFETRAVIFGQYWDCTNLPVQVPVLTCLLPFNQYPFQPSVILPKKNLKKLFMPRYNQSIILPHPHISVWPLMILIVSKSWNYCLENKSCPIDSRLIWVWDMKKKRPTMAMFFFLPSQRNISSETKIWFFRLFFFKYYQNFL